MNLTETIENAFSAGEITRSSRDNLTEWLGAGFLPAWALKAIEELVAAKEWNEINDRFFKKIAFGTGGMRGRTIGKVTPPAEAGTRDALGAPEHTAVGTANLNDFNIVRATVARATSSLSLRDFPARENLRLRLTPYMPKVTDVLWNRSRPMPVSFSDSLTSPI